MGYSANLNRLEDLETKMAMVQDSPYGTGGECGGCESTGGFYTPHFMAAEEENKNRKKLRKPETKGGYTLWKPGKH